MFTKFLKVMLWALIGAVVIISGYTLVACSFAGAQEVPSVQANWVEAAVCDTQEQLVKYQMLSETTPEDQDVMVQGCIPGIYLAAEVGDGPTFQGKDGTWHLVQMAIIAMHDANGTRQLPRPIIRWSAWLEPATRV